MSLWQEYDIGELVAQILRNAANSSDEHHLGSAFLTAYQIAIEFDRLHHEIVIRIDLPIGGAGAGQHTSLSQYLARELSRRIRNGEIENIEGGFLSNLHLDNITFQHGDNLITSSLTGTQSALSMFRWAG